MLVLDYSQITNRQFEQTRGLNLPNTQLVNMLSFLGLRKLGINYITRKFKRLYITLEDIMLELKGIQADLQLKAGSLNDGTIKILIERFEHQAAIYATLETSFQETAEVDSQTRFPIIKDCQAVSFETMDVLYSIIRLLKRYSKITPVETSPLALDSNARSVNSLKRIMNGR